MHLIVYSDEVSFYDLDPAFHCVLTFNSSLSTNSTFAGRELKARCCLSWLSVRFGSNEPKGWSNLSIQGLIWESLVGSGGFQPFLCHLPCLARKPNECPGERGAWSAKCDRASWVWVVCTLEAEVRDSSLPSCCCSFMASGALGLEFISYNFLIETYLLFPPHADASSKYGLARLTVSR